MTAQPWLMEWTVAEVSGEELSVVVVVMLSEETSLLKELFGETEHEDASKR